MLHRIKWEEDIVTDASGNENPNKCVLVWEVCIGVSFNYLNVLVPLFPYLIPTLAFYRVQLNNELLGK